ncbi:glycosyltransferase family 2 protein [Carboxylicivirga sp. N1Y90]|uniref:glycosyltransferase family 2 protein n=1 Tax=Carboxylicivirga fragile TaxID=3417571 RepID=UPI003D3291AB|nr:glycosyltransferase [Marinilabiliaceae bacterium N1Y90]
MDSVWKAFNERFEPKEEYLGTDKEVNNSCPLVSVVVPTYRHEKFIDECINSIISQKTNFSFEIIIGEDGSDDDTLAICKKYAEKHTNLIRLFIRDRNTSNYLEGNKTLFRFNNAWCRESARGKYIAMCEGDDYWTDSLKLQKQADFLESNPDYTLCFHAADVFLQKEHRITKDTITKVPSESTSISHLIVRGNYIHTPTVMHRRENVVSPPPEFFYSIVGDYFLNMLSAEKGLIKYLPETMAIYRIHSGGVWSTKAEKSRMIEWIKLLIALLRYFSRQRNDKITKQIANKIKQQQKHFIINELKSSTGRISYFYVDKTYNKNWSLKISRYRFLRSKLSYLFKKVKSIHS